MIIDSLLSSGRRRRRKSSAEISHALAEIRAVSAEATLNKCTGASERRQKDCFFPPLFLLHINPFTTKVSFSGSFSKTRLWIQKRMLPKRLLYRRDLTSLLAPWLQTLQSGRNGTTFPRGLLNVCLIWAVFWDPSLSKHPTPQDHDSKIKKSHYNFKNNWKQFPPFPLNH